MAVAIEAAELLTLQAAWKLDQGADDRTRTPRWPSCSPREALGRVTDTAVQVYGGMGLMAEVPVERWWRDARVERIWDGTSEIQRLIISRALLRPRETATR